MRVSRIILRAFSAFAIAAFLAGCAGRTGILPPPVTGEPAFREFRWPVNGKVASGFGARGDRHHDGLDILAPEGTEVLAVVEGIVAYAGDSLRGYGNAAILDHGGGITTLYGHLRDIRVKSGEVVSRGTVIGTVGRTGNATTSHLHFEIRIDGRSVDPANHLPGRIEPQ
jgi:murein DD-endopeptidase MepM/ murein hydrolase activator NlpD